MDSRSIVGIGRWLARIVCTITLGIMDTIKNCLGDCYTFDRSSSILSWVGFCLSLAEPRSRPIVVLPAQ